MFGSTVLSLAQWEQVREFVSGTHEGNVVGIELSNPLMTNVILAETLLDNGEDADERYTRGENRVFLVCGKDVIAEFLGANTETTEVQA